MTTDTSTPPTRDVLPPEEATPRQPSWAAKVLLIALIACVTAGVLVSAGVFDTSSSSDIKLDPVSDKPASAGTTAAPRPADAKVVTDYLAAMKSWNECMAKHAADATTDKCGDMPAQVDSPALNAYLNDVLNW